MQTHELRDALAALAHEQWSGWMVYLFGLSQKHEDGTATIPADKVARWERQCATAYADLPPDEQLSDQAEADRVLAVLAITNAGDAMRVHCTTRSDGTIEVHGVTIERGAAVTTEQALELKRYRGALALIARGERGAQFIARRALGWHGRTKETTDNADGNL